MGLFQHFMKESAPEVEEEKKEDFQAEEEKDDKEKDPVKYQCYQEGSGDLAEIKEMLSRLVSYIEGGDDEEEEDEQMQDEETMPPEEGEEEEEDEVPSNKPGSVAYQALQQEIADLKKQVAFQAESSEDRKIEEEVKEMCDVNPRLCFGTVMKQVRKFSSADDKRAFLETLPQMTFNGSAPETFQMNDVKDESPEIVALARKASTDYQHTINQSNQRNAQAFQKQWGTQENFVKTVVQLEKDRPGAYEEMFGG